MVWCTTAKNESAGTIVVRNQAIERRPREQGFKALGSIIQFDGGFSLDLELRTQKFWNMFWANKNYLCCAAVSANTRLNFLQTMAKQILGWCWGSWNITKREQEHLRGTQQAMLRKMFKAPVFDGPGADFELFEAWGRKIKNLKANANFIDFHILQRKAVLDWAGHLARIPASRSESHTANHTLEWKGIAAQIWHEKIYRTQGHAAGSGKPWRWEQIVWGAFGPNWKELAQDREWWKEETGRRSFDDQPRYCIAERTHHRK